MTERWREIAGFDGAYEISDMGRFRRALGPAGIGRNTEPGKILGAPRDCNGYPRAVLYDRVNRKARSIAVHTAVLEAFVGLRPEGTEASHLNGIRHDGRLSNLCWETRSDNHRRKIAHGTLARGERHKLSKLTDAKVLQIRRRSATETQQSLADEYGVARETVCNVIRRTTWAHVA